MDWLYTQFGFSMVLLVLVIGAVMTAVGYCTFFERKISAWLQDRHGPNRAGPFGLLQPLADGVKFILKEDIIPKHVDKPIYILAPAIAFIISMLGLAVIPWGGQYVASADSGPLAIQIAQPPASVLFVLAVGALSVYGVVLGSWASNNKYSFYGGMRAAAQMLSYEIPLALGVLIVVLTVGDLRLEAVVASQTESLWGFIPRWNVFLHPAVFVVLFITALAETNRAPFDLAECEQELVGGFHTEYSSMKFALFFLGEYTHIIVASAFLSVLFFGGWHVPGLDVVQHSWWGVLIQVSVSAAKIGLFIFVFMWVRWTLPRFRFDQLMRTAWKGLIPLMMLLFVATCVMLLYDLHQTFWATLCELVVVLVFGGCVMLTSGEITGRQRHLRPVQRPRKIPSSVTVKS